MLTTTLNPKQLKQEKYLKPDLHLSTHGLDTVPKEVSNIKLTVNEATKHTVP
jgi:hypothetical protein